MIEPFVSKIFLTSEITTTKAGKDNYVFMVSLSRWPELEKATIIMSSHFHFHDDRSLSSNTSQELTGIRLFWRKSCLASHDAVILLKVCMMHYNPFESTQIILWASFWAISMQRSVWERSERLRNVWCQKNDSKFSENTDALCSQTCTFCKGWGSGCVLLQLLGSFSTFLEGLHCKASAPSKNHSSCSGCNYLPPIVSVYVFKLVSGPHPVRMILPEFCLKTRRNVGWLDTAQEEVAHLLVVKLQRKWHKTFISTPYGISGDIGDNAAASLYNMREGGIKGLNVSFFSFSPSSDKTWQFLYHVQ